MTLHNVIILSSLKVNLFEEAICLLLILSLTWLALLPYSPFLDDIVSSEASLHAAKTRILQSYPIGQ